MTGDCPNPELHHQPGMPTGLFALTEWAEKMSETHDQKRCPACRHWRRWVPKKVKEPA